MYEWEIKILVDNQMVIMVMLVGVYLGLIYLIYRCEKIFEVLTEKNND